MICAMALNGLQAQKWLEKVNKAKDDLLGGGLSQEEAGKGLKEALDLGVA